MSDHIKGFVVSLDQDYHSDDAARIKEAILMLKGVQGVKESVANPDDWMNRQRIHHELTMKILGVLKP